MDRRAVELENDLRRSLQLIAEEEIRFMATQRKRQDHDRQQHPHRFTRVRLVLVAAAIIGAIGSVTVATRYMDGGASQGPEGAGDSISRFEWIACSRMIAEGHIIDVQSAGEPGRLLVTLQVTNWIKPLARNDGVASLADGHAVTLNVVDPWPLRLRDEPLRVGGPVLVLVNGRDDEPADVYQAHEITSIRRSIARDLPKASNITCPAGWGPGQAPPPPGGQDW